MGATAFDTYAAAKTLREAGFDERQAEAAVTMVRDAVTEGVATKADLDKGLGALRTDLDKGLAALKAELKTDMADLETRLTVRFVGIAVGIVLAYAGATVAAVAALVKLLP